MLKQMNMPGFTCGDRVYIANSDSYGDVKRTTFLGKPGIVLYNDDGTLGGFSEKTSRTNIFSKTTNTNGMGETIESPPMDVRVEGVPILNAMNIPPENHQYMFFKFKEMFPKEQRRAYMREWEEKKDDQVQRTLFLNNFMQVLDDDEDFIANEERKALVYVEPEVQKKMFSKFLTTVDRSTRQQYILEWVLAKNDRRKKEVFLQKMYELLMDDDDYIKMEGRKALASINVPFREHRRIFFRFLRISSVEDRRKQIAEWRKVRRSRSRAFFFLKNFIGLVGTDEIDV